MNNLSNSNNLSSLFYLPLPPEPNSEQINLASVEGVYIGNSIRRSVPIFINFRESLNPHILICGMTGGGKTFLARSLVIRLHLLSSSSIIIIDFTGEYSSVLSGLSLFPEGGIGSLMTGREGIAYLDLHELSEEEKVSAASKTIDGVAKLMRKRKPGEGRDVFILLDEAWKLIEHNKGLEVIIREGRKYGVGLITSSQLLHDTNSTILSNIATIFIFKTTNKKNLELISRNYNLPEKELYSIQNLEQGSCFLIQLRKNGSHSALVIRKIVGVSEPKLICLRKGANMELKIGIDEFEGLLMRLDVLDKAPLASLVDKELSVDLSTLIKKLIQSGADRRAILKEMKHMGFSDSAIADSFSFATSQIDEDYERK